MRYIAEVDRAKERYFIGTPIFYTEHDDVIEWLENTPGQGFSLDWPDAETEYFSENRGIHFYDEKDATLFLLRWS